MWKKLFLVWSILFGLYAQIGSADAQKTWQFVRQYDDKILHTNIDNIASAQIDNTSVILTGMGAYAVFDINGKVRFTKSSFNALVEVVPSHDSHLLAFGDPGDKWHISDIYSGEIKFSGTEATGIMSGAYSPDDTKIALGYMRGGVVLIDLLANKRRRLFETTKFVDFITFSQDGKKILTTDYSDVEKYRQYRVFDSNTGKELFAPLGRRFDGIAHHNFKPMFMLDGNIVTANDSFLDLYNSQTGQLMHSITGGHQGRVSSVAQKPASTILVYGTDKGELLAWDLNERNLLAPIRGYNDVKEIRFIQFNCDGTRMLTTRERPDDKTVVVWDTSSSDPWKWKQVATLTADRAVKIASFGPRCGGIITDGGGYWEER